MSPSPARLLLHHHEVGSHLPKVPTQGPGGLRTPPHSCSTKVHHSFFPLCAVPRCQGHDNYLCSLISTENKTKQAILHAKKTLSQEKHSPEGNTQKWASPYPSSLTHTFLSYFQAQDPASQTVVGPSCPSLQHSEPARLLLPNLQASPARSLDIRFLNKSSFGDWGKPSGGCLSSSEERIVGCGHRKQKSAWQASKEREKGVVGQRTRSRSAPPTVSKQRSWRWWRPCLGAASHGRC